MAVVAVSPHSTSGPSHHSDVIMQLDASKNFDFDSKVKFESQKASAARRSRLYEPPVPPFMYNVWKVQPPNFNPQAFEPSPVKRNSRDAMQPWKFEQIASFRSDEVVPTAAQRRHSDRRMQEYFRQLEGGSERRAKTCGDMETRHNFKLRFRMTDPHEARIEFVKHGTYPSGIYRMPQPHDYRQYPSLKTLGLDEFATDHQRDCMGLRTKTQGIRTLTGRPIDVLRKVPFRSRSEYAMPRHAKWDNELILPKLPFPNKVAAYTRHRRTDRSARSAYLERAESMMRKRHEEVKEFRAKFTKQIES